MRLDGRTIIVTGGASGLGLATVEMALAAGGRAVILDVNEQAGTRLRRVSEIARGSSAPT